MKLGFVGKEPQTHRQGEVLGKPRDNQTPAMLYPLFVGVAWPDRAQKTARVVQSVLPSRKRLIKSSPHKGV